ncbi:hypothetical protein HK097_011529 [Rhizophlyctis rosea]|uniref:Uncharacterized protein n=1 Tax=Rhizophlyctis rosea TaxID=64517 RepID=A0AAD5SHM6_9FUNG|nr:hypothetical protein HK097_011529 [Rhizophlyctis rosea]
MDWMNISLLLVGCLWKERGTYKWHLQVETFTDEDAQIIESRIAALEAAAAQGRHSHAKHWPQTEADLLRALLHKYPEHTQKQLAQEYLKMVLPDGDWKLTETQVLHKIQNAARKA